MDDISFNLCYIINPAKFFSTCGLYVAWLFNSSIFKIIIDSTYNLLGKFFPDRPKPKVTCKMTCDWLISCYRPICFFRIQYAIIRDCHVTQISQSERCILYLLIIFVYISTKNKYVLFFYTHIISDNNVTFGFRLSGKMLSDKL